MSTYTAQVVWQLGKHESCTDHRYSRRHLLRFDGGAQVAASASPGIVAPPWSDASAVDPEEMFVAALASCHMLWFLDLAARRGLGVQSYVDDAVGTLARDASGRPAMTRVTLRPRVVYAGHRQPSADEQLELHRQAHDHCYIAQSVKTELRCEPRD